MKKKFMLICFFVSLFASVSAQDNTPPSLKKYYCNAEQIELTDSMILVHLEEKIFEIDSLLSDQGGLYFTEEMLRCTYCRRPVRPKNICECPHPQL